MRFDLTVSLARGPAYSFIEKRAGPSFFYPPRVR